MKKVLAIALLVLLCAGMACASVNNWGIAIYVDNGTDNTGGNPNIQVGAKSSTTDGWELAGEGSPIDWVTVSSDAKVVGVACAGDVYMKSYQKNTKPSVLVGNEYQKVWDVYAVGAAGTDLVTPIRLSFKTMASAQQVPTGTFAGDPSWATISYRMVVIDGKNKVANGTVYNLPVAGVGNSTFFGPQISLPTIKMTSNSNQNMMEQGYHLQFIQAVVATDPNAVVPEPSSLLALGTGLMGLAGFVSRKRRA